MDAWELRERDGLSIVAYRGLEAVAGVHHGFSTRRDRAGGDLDLGSATGPNASIDSRRQRLCAAVGLGRTGPVVVRQVHGNRIVESRSRGPSSSETIEADGLIALACAAAMPPIAVRTADCVPVLVADRGGRAVAAIHAGWRGTAAAILSGALQRLGELGLDVRRLVVALGPAIGPCCYTVGPEVLEAIAAGCEIAPATIVGSSGANGTTVDLRRALAIQAEAAGVPRRSISSAPWCTFCRPELFFSYRREGRAAGRQMAVIGWSGDLPGLTTAPG